MTIVADIIQRLQDIAPPVFRLVGGAAEFAAISSVPTAMPAAYVMIEEEASQENERSTGPVLQLCQADVAVVIITGNVSDFVGGAAAADIGTLKGKVRAALIGFVPSIAAGGNPIEHVGGQLLRVKGGTVWHRETFGAVYYLEEQP